MRFGHGFLFDIQFGSSQIIDALEKNNTLPLHPPLSHQPNVEIRSPCIFLNQSFVCLSSYFKLNLALIMELLSAPSMIFIRWFQMISIFFFILWSYVL